MVTKKYIQIRQRAGRFIKKHILHADDSPHRIALGAAFGLFIAWSPLLGLHTWLVLLLSIIFRANKLVALIFIWVSNPFTFIPIYYPSYLLGKNLLKYFNYQSRHELSDVQLSQTLNNFSSSFNFTSIFSIEFWRMLFGFLWHRGTELMVGSLVIGLVVAIIGYYAIYYFIVWYRKVHPHKNESANNS
jgi:uncharacterized protein (DUF2062 family)